MAASWPILHSMLDTAVPESFFSSALRQWGGHVHVSSEDSLLTKPPATALSNSERFPKLATPLHTIFVLVFVGSWSIGHKVFAGQQSAAADPHRTTFYLATILYEWLLLFFVAAGVKDRRLLIGKRWNSIRQVLRDVGIAAVFWAIASLLLWIFGLLLRPPAIAPNVSMLPHQGTELVLWIALSITAGICEEMIFRGYLQGQFIALTKNGPYGIVISAIAFGAAHAYQGLRMVILISLFGAMFGILAYWCGSVRPGIIAHAWQDSLSGVLASLSAP
jgi:uncharacterized protein